MVPSSSQRAALLRVLPPLLLTGAFSLVCAWIAGVSLGMVIGGFVIITLVLPPMSAGQADFRGRLVILGCCASAVAATWMALVRPEAATFFQWGELSLTMAAYAAGLAGLVAVVERVGVAPLLAGGATVILGLAWLTWPIWLSPSMARGMSDESINRLVEFHPPLVANGILTFTPPWTEQSVAYGLTVLNQDVPISLPNNALRCIGLHAFLGGLFFLAAFTGIRRTPMAEAVALQSPQSAKCKS